ncbi:MAG TPA: GDSL-type esterase/lipase family protein [Gammaproteobacteria bacterium]|nr:GDSL-type esterase/lipase family protein [Gammaproteobacteria bacterium]
MRNARPGKRNAASFVRAATACLVLVLGIPVVPVSAQQASLPAPMEWTTEQDHADMLDQLGITTLRPGPSGRDDAPNPANYDESIANPYPDWPDLLTRDNGERVTSAEAWWQARRPEIVEAFEREVVGRIPPNVPAVEWSVTQTAEGTLAGHPVTGREVTGRVDNSSYPPIEVEIVLTVVLPDDAEVPVPVMILFRGGGLDEALGLAAPPRFGGGGDQGPQDPPANEQLIAAGWGFAYLDPGSIQADNGAGLTRGIIGLVNKGQPRTPDDWGSLRAWSWGAARALDYFETDPAIDTARVGIEGVSRYGKAALVTLAFEPRFAVGLVGSSGEGGVSPYRRNFGEMVENITGRGEYHWVAGNFLKYGTAESSFGSMNANDLPVDSHALIALAAPRATFISYGIPERGDALWLDQKGSYMATVAAGKVFALLGVGAVGTDEHYQTAELPPVNQALLDGQLAWRQHDGGHTDAPNWKYFIPWANRGLGIAPRVAGGRDAVPEAAIAFPRTDPNSDLAHQALLAKKDAGVIDVYFIGDSITRRWGALDYPDLLAHWNESFHGFNAANFAWGGDRTENILWRLENGELDGVDPKVVVIQAGTNNVGRDAGGPVKVEPIAAGIEAIIETARAKAPNAAIVLTGIFPRSDPDVVGEIEAINRRLEATARAEGVRYIDINDALAAPDGLLLDTMSSDGLHLSQAGYEVWANALEPVLTELLGARGDEDLAPPPTGNPAAGPYGD